MQEKEIELYLDNRFLELTSDDLEIPNRVLLFLRDKSSGSGFPVVFITPVAQIIFDAMTGREETPINAFILLERLLLHTSAKLLKAEIYDIKNDQFHTKLYFLINKKEIVEEVNTAVAFSMAIRAKAPIVIPEEIFIQAVDTTDAEQASNILQEAEDKSADKNDPTN